MGRSPRHIPHPPLLRAAAAGKRGSRKLSHSVAAGQASVGCGKGREAEGPEVQYYRASIRHDPKAHTAKPATSIHCMGPPSGGLLLASRPEGGVRFLAAGACRSQAAGREEGERAATCIPAQNIRGSWMLRRTAAGAEGQRVEAPQRHLCVTGRDRERHPGGSALRPVRSRRRGGRQLERGVDTAQSVREPAIQAAKAHIHVCRFHR